MSTIIVGILIASLLIWAAKRTQRDLKNSKCGGCSGCGLNKQCHSIEEAPVQLKL
ncbi:FeoB-associated Cys-rich membrane protein [Fusibacter ferrireducens]|uniref:FeoB-associated Cys-rich membrane protein n=1 Tax=Fusibacter ferrireducens TaxID=2785058 RepID=A0ABR9ZQE1_9FIRM|nr:FeoB-associated Cys-rich membrane protein [Fusibacter ferrireducens]MBF4692358.1 FeoB-associated Cys-rich membrane protein [Fusibacter ferrireducens]